MYIIVGVIVITLLLFIYIQIRNKLVYIFMLKCINLAGDYEARRAKEDKNYIFKRSESALAWFYDSLPSYHYLLYKSVKPLKVKYWFNKEQLEEIYK